ncbi:MAG: hypothetical protein ACTSRA_11175 [Promethearchaeota archaeon]
MIKKKHDDYSRLKDILKNNLQLNFHLNNEVMRLQNEIKKINNEIFQNELTPEKLREIMLIDYDDDERDEIEY